MSLSPQAFRAVTLRHLDELPQFARLDEDVREAVRVVGHVLPFRANRYVIDELIDWDAAPDDPIFQLTFPQRDMLDPDDYALMQRTLARGSAAEVAEVADGIRLALNPHPSGQLTNVPYLDGRPVPGVQHKYGQTCLVFPSSGQTCHAYCTYCFRWPQFVGGPDLRFATDREMTHLEYIRRHTEITDVLITGGDSMVMRTEVLARHVEPLLGPGFEHVRTIRFGTKMLGYWPYRVLTDADADGLLRLLERIVASGRHAAVMAHFSHWRELQTPAVQRAIGRIRATGAQIRTQAPLIGHVNDDAAVWARMWSEQVALGLVPYYMFVERDTGASRYFGVPLRRALDIYRDAIAAGSGLARTARGPVMSAHPGKVVVEGISEIGGSEVAVLSFLQARDPDWCKRPFFAEMDADATWLTDLRPFGADEFFYERRLRELELEHALEGPSAVRSGDPVLA